MTANASNYTCNNCNSTIIDCRSCLNSNKCKDYLGLGGGGIMNLGKFP